ncbi:lysophospholipid acyltransferase family protein [Carboxylicivirga marina]|uniref:lysophospholipid acyltransferase family protein n=1 Tax=Carboxylicivirga marina TaxID=2800988 RepID=UPI0025989282|nr:lysophospholipid acyltransferase family protein [uncultured Carboxylicivirga sp.]
MKRKHYRLMNLLTTGIFLSFVAMVSIMPFRVLYWFSNIAAIVMRKAVRYRHQVIYSNLEQSFPDKSKKEIDLIAKGFYQNLTDNLLESFKSFTMTKSSIIKRHKIINPELLESLLKEHNGIIGVTAHYANWEWGSQSGSIQCSNHFMALYKPLKNKYINKILLNSRAKCGTELVPINETSEMFERTKNKKRVYLLAADQSPSKGRQLDNAYWLNFLKQKTAFLYGPEKYAKRYNYPIVYIDIQRVKRGYYEVKLSTLVEKPLELTEGTITELYKNKVEDVILTNPSDWLWSHKRWKHSPK